MHLYHWAPSPLIVSWDSNKLLTLIRFLVAEQHIVLLVSLDIFSSEPFSTTGYKLGVCHGWFHLHGSTRYLSSADWQLHNKNSCTQWYTLTVYYCMVPRGRCSKIFCRVLHLINSLQSANVLIKQTAKQYKYYMTKIQEKSFCYIYHMVQVI